MSKFGTIGLAILLLLGFTGTARAYTCSFNTAPLPLSFGNLDPGIGSDTMTTSSFTIRCSGSIPADALLAISDDDGLNETGIDANRMINSACPLGTAYLPYSLAYSSPVSAPKGKPLTVTATGTVLGSVYQDACLGVYNDTVTFTVSP